MRALVLSVLSLSPANYKCVHVHVWEVNKDGHERGYRVGLRIAGHCPFCELHDASNTHTAVTVSMSAMLRQQHKYLNKALCLPPFFFGLPWSSRGSFVIALTLASCSAFLMAS